VDNIIQMTQIAEVTYEMKSQEGMHSFQITTGTFGLRSNNGNLNLELGISRRLVFSNLFHMTCFQSVTKRLTNEVK
jgi:hypothetical protein